MCVTVDRLVEDAIPRRLSRDSRLPNPSLQTSTSGDLLQMTRLLHTYVHTYTKTMTLTIHFKE